MARDWKFWLIGGAASIPENRWTSSLCNYKSIPKQNNANFSKFVYICEKSENWTEKNQIALKDMTMDVSVDCLIDLFGQLLYGRTSIGWLIDWKTKHEITDECILDSAEEKAGNGLKYPSISTGKMISHILKRNK